MWTPNRRIRKGKSLGSFLFCFPSLPLQLSYIFSCLPVHYNDMFLRAQNPVCSSCRNLEGICESAIQALLTLGTKLKCNKDRCWVHHSGGKMRERRKFPVIHLVSCFFFSFSSSDMLHSYTIINYIKGLSSQRQKLYFAGAVTYF